MCVWRGCFLEFSDFSSGTLPNVVQREVAQETLNQFPHFDRIHGFCLKYSFLFVLVSYIGVCVCVWRGCFLEFSDFSSGTLPNVVQREVAHVCLNPNLNLIFRLSSQPQKKKIKILIDVKNYFNLKFVSHMLTKNLWKQL